MSIRLRARHFIRPSLGLFAAGFLPLLGTLPRVAPAQGVMTVLHTFAGMDGYYPNKGLLLAKDGNFYGVTPQTSSYYGSVFQVTPAGVFTTIHTFSDTDGKDPEGVLVQGGDGFLYGTTESGGPLGDSDTDAGTVFKLNTDGSGFQTLHVFVRDVNPNSPTYLDYPTGRFPEAGLTVGPDGDLYGTTSDGGARNAKNGGSDGTVFKISPTGAFQLIYSFNVQYGGDTPRARLALDADGSFYSTTAAGGPAGEIGTIFNITTAGKLTYLLNFVDAEGHDPESGLVLAPDGKYYGLTEAGGTDNDGTYYRISRTGGFELLGSFTNTNGAQPFDDMILATDGNLYGTTLHGGDGSIGAIFQLTTAGVLNIVYTFPNNGMPGYGMVGYDPKASLVQGADGRLYGTTVGDSIASGFGTVFAFSLNPVINSASSASVDKGPFFRYQITATNTPTRFAATGLPAGLSINTTTGLISGTLTQSGVFNVTLSATNGMGTGTSTLTISPSFFAGAETLGNGVSYLAFPSGNYFGYYSYLTNPNYFYHFDLGYEYVFDANDGHCGVYLYDFKSSGFFYTSPGFPFPYLYDFNLKSVVYYYPDPHNAGHYNTNGIRYFYVFRTGQIISK